MFDIVEASIADLRDALESGQVTSVELMAAYLERIARFDRHGEHLNSVPVLNPGSLRRGCASPTSVERPDGPEGRSTASPIRSKTPTRSRT